jgi:hypothetical protein
MLMVAVGQKVERTPEQFEAEWYRETYSFIGTWSESYSQQPVILLMRFEMYIVVKI